METMNDLRVEAGCHQPLQRGDGKVDCTVIYAVIYASAGCLPDSEYPEFEGTMDECERFIQEYAHEYERLEVEHDLYSLEIVDAFEEGPPTD